MKPGKSLKFLFEFCSVTIRITVMLKISGYKVMILCHNDFGTYMNSELSEIFPVHQIASLKLGDLPW